MDRPPAGPRPPWVYLALAGLRCLMVLAPGYVHPDEFFQGGQELFAGLLLGVPGCVVPWEFRPQHAVRFVGLPFLVAGLPFALLKHVIGPALHRLGLIADPSAVIRGPVLLYLPRLVMVALSFVQDWCILQLMRRHSKQHREQQPVARRTRQAAKQDAQQEASDGSAAASRSGGLDPWAAVTLFAASWPALLFGSRPFSNTLEAVLLALTLYTFHLDGASTSWRRMRLGACFGLGCFVRFTFPAFALPLGLAELWEAATSSASHKGATNLGTLLRCILALGTGLLLAAVPMVLADSWFYAGFDGHQWRAPLGSSSWLAPLTLCPLNALRYNASPTNLATHGLHPRVTHALVNLPLLFSTPGLVALLRHLVFHQPSPSPALHAARRTNLAVVLSGLGLLSLAPHQEPRFLLPLGVPLALLFALTPPTGLTRTRAASALGACVKAIFVLQSFICLLLFGGLHQAGVVPALFHLERQHREGAGPLVFYKTYMPPRFLLAGRAGKGTPPVEVVDLSVPDESGRLPTLRDLAGEQDFVLVAPASVDLNGGDGGLHVPMREVGRVWPHLSMEDPPRSWSEMALVMYKPEAPPDEAGAGERDAEGTDATDNQRIEL